VHRGFKIAIGFRLEGRGLLRLAEFFNGKFADVDRKGTAGNFGTLNDFDFRARHLFEIVREVLHGIPKLLTLEFRNRRRPLKEFHGNVRVVGLHHPFGNTDGDLCLPFFHKSDVGRGKARADEEKRKKDRANFHGDELLLNNTRLS